MPRSNKLFLSTALLQNLLQYQSKELSFVLSLKNYITKFTKINNPHCLICLADALLTMVAAVLML